MQLFQFDLSMRSLSCCGRGRGLEQRITEGAVLSFPRWSSTARYSSAVEYESPEATALSLTAALKVLCHELLAGRLAVPAEQEASLSYSRKGHIFVATAGSPHKNAHARKRPRQDILEI